MTPAPKTRLTSGLIPAISQRPVAEVPKDAVRATYLVAIRTKEGIICVRNCHCKKRDVIVVENIGAVLRLREVNQPLATVERHAVVHEPPFSVRVHSPGFMRDLSPSDYEGAMAAAESLSDTKWTRDEAEKKETPFQVLLDSWREEVGIWRPWTATRISLLAAGLSITREELAQLIGCTHGELAHAMTKDGESGFSNAQLLWLFYYEQFVQWVRFGRKPVSLFPDSLLDARPKGRCKGPAARTGRAGSAGLNAGIAARLSQ